MKPVRLNRASVLASWFAGIMVLASPLAQAANDAFPLQNQVLGGLVSEVLRPMASDFARTSVALASTSRNFCDGRATLDAVQAAWRSTQSHWQALEMMPIGPVSENRLHRQINAWPLRLRLLQPVLKEGDTATAQTVRRMGAAGKGLPAVEYLLFEASGTLRVSHCGALRALTAHISEQAQVLEQAWKEPDGGFGRQLALAGLPGYDGIFASADQAISDIVNLLIAGLDTIKTRKLGKALEKSVDAPALGRIESWRSQSSLDHMADNLRGFEQVFLGKGESGIGLDDYLVSLKRPGLVRAISRQLKVTKQALAQIRPPLQTAVMEQRQAAETLHKELAWLQHLMETEVAKALKVDLGFNANDGD